jgi:MYXO-CTERM domain-containing protein
MEWDRRLLDQMGVDYEFLQSGCCGLAGSFGFEAEKYDVSVKVGERVLLPKVRESSEDTLILMNGFSCQEQTRQLAGRESVHIAEVLRMALRDQGQEPAVPEEAGEKPKVRRAMLAAAVVAMVALAVRRRRRNHSTRE